ncbi:IS3 family transposase, partial [Faecalibacterium sp. An77]|uniref:IS3 family transposase n=1 Tax=Faecalibacterium sp. An77 TaxID=1965655 RepID=UPI00118578D8
RPNSKWVTDISYIHTEQGVLYLSMIRDLYDNSIVAYKTAAQQTVNLVLDTIRLAMKKEKVAGELQLHSDQGFQYTSHGYFKLTQSYGITPSMSRRGNCYDNAMAENFFGILKTECIYRQKLKTFQQANDLIDEYIHFYNHERLQTKTGLAPLSLRQASL